MNKINRHNQFFDLDKVTLDTIDEKINNRITWLNDNNVKFDKLFNFHHINSLFSHEKNNNKNIQRVISRSYHNKYKIEIIMPCSMNDKNIVELNKLYVNIYHANNPRTIYIRDIFDINEENGYKLCCVNIYKKNYFIICKSELLNNKYTYEIIDKMMDIYNMRQPNFNGLCNNVNKLIDWLLYYDNIRNKTIGEYMGDAIDKCITSPNYKLYKLLGYIFISYVGVIFMCAMYIIIYIDNK